MATKPFCPTMNKDALALIRKARKHNNDLDKIDRKNGNTTPADCDLDVHLRTAISALDCALVMKDWDVVAQAYCLLQDAELRVRDMLPD